MTYRLRSALVSAGLSAALVIGGLALAPPHPALAQEHPVIRPTGVQPEQRIDVNGSLLSITYVENASQASAMFFEGQRYRFQRASGDPMGRPYGLLLTSDMNGQPSFVVLDLSWLSEEDEAGFVNLAVAEPGTVQGLGSTGTHESIQVKLQPQTDGTYLAREYWELAKGSKVNNTDWGVQEQYTTRDDSINARTDNGPDDDEARAQGPTRRTGDDDD